MATRRTMDDAYRGGRITPEEDAPQPARYSCFAAGCPMPGTIFMAGTDKQGVCAWHYAVLPGDIPKVTNALKAWECVTYEVNEAKRALTGELAADPAGLQRAFETAWERLKPLAGVWEHELRPGNIRSSKGEDRGYPEHYSDWMRRLERFIGARVVEVLSVNQQRKAA